MSWDRFSSAFLKILRNNLNGIEVFFLLFNLNGYLDAAKMSKPRHHSHEKMFSSGNHLLKHFNQLV